MREESKEGKGGAGRPSGVWIGGRETSAASRKRFPVFNPANGEVLKELPYGTREDAARAVRVAAGVAASWRERPPKERCDRLRTIHRLIRDRRVELATLRTLEMGAPVVHSLAQIEFGGAYFQFYSDPNLLGTRQRVDETSC